MSSREFDVVVLGAGPAGENAADRAHRNGLTVAVVEASRVGGECSYFACIPSKVLLRAPDLLAAASRVPGAAEGVSGGVDAAALFKRRDVFTARGDDGAQAEWLDGSGITLLRGTGRISGERTVDVEHPDGTVTPVTANHAVVVATGSVPNLPPVPGLESVRPWTNREATAAEQVPDSLLVLGGGVVGCELATAYRRLGSDVTIVQHGDRLLPAMDPAAGDMVASALRSDGVHVRLGAAVRSVRRSGNTVFSRLDHGEEIATAELLVATGRRPSTADIGLDRIGLTTGRPLSVDGTTSVIGVDGRWLYAVGDSTDGAALTHMGKYQGRVCGDVIASRARGGEIGGRYSNHRASAEESAVPQVVFTDPQVGHVGLLEQAARDAGFRVRTTSYDIGATAGGAIHSDGYTGFAKLVVDADRDVVVGATLVGHDIAEMLHAATIAVVGEVPLQRLWHAVPAFPTMSEVWLRLLEGYGV